MKMVEQLAEDRDGFRFRGGSLALDLAATLQGRLQKVRRDLLEEPADLARWFVASGLVASLPKISADDLDKARRLREAIFKLAAEAHSAGFDQQELAVLNQIAATPAAVPALKPDGHIELDPSAAGLLSLLAREAIQLLGSERRDRLKICQSPSCSILFIDSTRSGERRWCSMNACGNKAKVAEFRRRKRVG